ncbi:MAG TPA: alpha/beta hydrolase [Candidatus Acidoferrales bacterium]|nr:alpha/beta hydrolase [Candidatus Acidoferrales bacterium]
MMRAIAAIIFGAVAFSTFAPVTSKAASSTSASSARDLYVRALRTMSQLDQPAYVTYTLQSTSNGLKGGVAARCRVWIEFGSNKDRWTIWHRTADYVSLVEDDANNTECISHHPFFDPTWYGAFHALSTGMINQIGTYRVSTVPTSPPIAQGTRAPDISLRTISSVAVLGPAIYNFEDRGQAACPNGDPGEAIHLWSRRDDPHHQLSDVIIDLRSTRFCMVRLGLRAPGALGGSFSLELHFNEVGRYWMVTDGVIEGMSRVFGVKSGYGSWQYRLTDMRFPSSLSDDIFVKAPLSAAFNFSPYMRAQHLVRIGSRSINLYCTGTGAPTIVLDASGGSDMLDWRFVQPLLAKDRRVCSYDRAGFGFSDPAPPPRDAATDATDLHALVEAGVLSPPFILVGYSFSTLSARIYADRYSDDLFGLVLVEPDIEDHQPALLATAPALAPFFAQGDAARNRCMQMLAADAKPNEAYDACAGPPDPAYPDTLDALIKTQSLRPQALQDRLSEDASGATTSTSEVRDEQRWYGELPVELITAADAFPPGTYLPTGQRGAEQAFMNSIRSSLLTHSARSTHVEIQNCSHGDIATSCAAAVAHAIDSLADTAATAVGAGATHATGVSASDVRAIEATVSGFRHEDPLLIDWYIAVDGQYAVAYDGCGPGACDENQLVRRNGSWIVTCYTTEGKGRFGTCLTPPKTEQNLCRMALSAIAPNGDTSRLPCQ